VLRETQFLNGRIKVFQPEKGYRFSVDSVLLANFVEAKAGELVLELGAGCGIISLLVLTRHPKARVFCLEKEATFVEALKLARKLNKHGNRLEVIQGDILNPPFKPGKVDVIFSNPPYFKKGAGRTSPFQAEEVARRGEPEFFEKFFKTCRALLRTRGRLYLIFTAFRSAEILYLLKKHGLEPKVLRFVHSYPGDEARMLLIKAVKCGGEEVRVLPPLYIYREKPKGKNKTYTREVEKMLVEK